MTKAMKLNVTYNGYYGGNVDGVLLLPLEINGVLFEELIEKTYARKVYLGEIEGKHSECYGDLEVDFVDLDSLSVKEVTDLINESGIGDFEVFFEEVEGDFEEDEEEYNEEKVNKLLKSYSIEPTKYMIKTVRVHEKFLEALEAKYIQKYKSINVFEEDYSAAIQVLKENSIKHFE
jgi:hypothetical protein